MNENRISKEKAGEIKKALEKHSRFLAYVRVNALLHDCDKSFAQFLLWSLLPGKERPDVPQYDKHNKSKEPGKASVKRKEYLQYWQNSVANTLEDIHNSVNIPFPASSCYAAYFDQDKNGPFYIIQDKTVPPYSIYDFLVYHHDRPDCIEQVKASTALFLFISGVSGIDGNDTGYETEMEAARKYSGHHTPETAQDNIVLISTPFGFEREADLGCAETACHFTKEINNVVAVLRHNNQPMHAVARFEEKLKQPFCNTVIRTARPINDVTLADHSISTAALTVAQAARAVFENIAVPGKKQPN
ncbi:MAG: hypothetical protein D3924_09565, partial [Candidatus Electrothrix sp. AR4]|nr:hypothetical protein [Candidatus Electrothrix sp. AR4]